MSLINEIKQGIQQLSLNFNDLQIKLMEQYVHLLHKWNGVYNLTAVHDLSDMVPRHVSDSLSISSFLEGEKILDVGSGAGLPGVILAIAHPNKNFVLIDSNGKKTRFILQAKYELGIDNITVINQRCERYHDEMGFDIILSRAFSSIPQMIELTKHLLKKDGFYFAMKGLYPKDELDVIDKKDVKLVHQYKLIIPGCKSQRHLIVLQRNNRQ